MFRKTPGPKSLARALATVCLLVSAASAVRADQFVTYNFVVDSLFTGVGPTSASFQVPLEAVLAGEISSFQITNIQFSFPGIDPLTVFTTGSSVGLDNMAFVDPTTGLPVFHDQDQGLAAIAYHDMPFGSVFLAILFDNPGGELFNAINGGPGSIGFGTGHWTATFPTATPEPASISLLVLGGVAVGARVLRRWAGLRGA